jgi:heptosyltransferase-2
VDEKTDFIDNDSIICFAPGAAHFTKRWPKEYFKQLGKKIRERAKHKIIILGGETDRELGAFLSDNDQVYDYTGKLSLLETGCLMSRARGLVTNDTGLMHMATAVNLPVLALFGSTVKSFGFFPYRGRVKVLENSTLSCRPCTHIGRSECPKNHFNCMKEITPEQVFNNLQAILDIG